MRAEHLDRLLYASQAVVNGASTHTDGSRPRVQTGDFARLRMIVDDISSAAQEELRTMRPSPNTEPDHGPYVVDHGGGFGGSTVVTGPTVRVGYIQQSGDDERAEDLCRMLNAAWRKGRESGFTGGAK